jgi:hypothetical protein
MKKIKKEIKMLDCPVNLKDYRAMYIILANDLCNAGIPSHHLGYLEILYNKAILNKDK